VTNWSRYPRPPDDTGAGYHMGANAWFPLGDNEGLYRTILDEFYRCGLRWAKILDADGTSYNACKACLDMGIMPVVRLYRDRPYPGQLTDKQKTVARQLVSIGVRYFERGNEPNLWWEWQDGKFPGATWNPWPDAVYNSLAADWLADAQYLASLGAYVALDAPSGGGDHDDITYFAGMLKSLKRLDGAASLLHDWGWIACHPAGLNHPLDYPEDPRNQQDHPGATILSAIPGEAPSSASNCIRKPEKYHQMFLDAMGFEIPIMATEGGFWAGSKQDPRYPELTVYTASDMTASWLRSMKDQPSWFLAAMPWLWANRIFANKFEAFERDAVKRIPGWGNCPATEPATLPLLADLLKNPCQRREVIAVPAAEPIANPTPQPEQAVAITAQELQNARDAMGITPATIKRAIERGYIWLRELYTPGDRYAFSLCYSTADKSYRLLKLETQQWQVVGETTL